MKTAFTFKLSSPDSAWTIDLTTPPGAVTEGVTGKATCTLELSDADFMAMATGQADAMKLFSSGKLKISGDVMASQKLGFLKKLTPEMVLAETKKRGGGASSAGADVPPVAQDFTPTVDDVFAVIEEYLKHEHRPRAARSARATSGRSAIIAGCSISRPAPAASRRATTRPTARSSSPRKTSSRSRRARPMR